MPPLPRALIAPSLWGLLRAFFTLSTASASLSLRLPDASSSATAPTSSTAFSPPAPPSSSATTVRVSSLRTTHTTTDLRRTSSPQGWRRQSSLLLRPPHPPPTSAYRLRTPSLITPLRFSARATNGRSPSSSPSSRYPRSTWGRGGAAERPQGRPPRGRRVEGLPPRALTRRQCCRASRGRTPSRLPFSSPRRSFIYCSYQSRVRRRGLGGGLRRLPAIATRVSLNFRRPGTTAPPREEEALAAARGARDVWIASIAVSLPTSCNCRRSASRLSMNEGPLSRRTG
mmetsp:Transcript_53931/g.161404  ORF Transcript_53931/g.161404 Transcript_53931/m.161404 type:complete len:285 (+) Transcript_53931:2244-3098(+)